MLYIFYILAIIMLIGVTVAMFSFFDYEIRRHNKSITHIYYRIIVDFK